MQSNQIISQEGDTLSRLAYQYYGSSAGQVERILEANPQLCRYPALLPAGVVIILPMKLAQKNITKTVNLWD